MPELDQGALDVPAIRQQLQALHFPADEVAKRVRQIYSDTLRDSAHIRQGNFTALTTQDLLRIFTGYDRLFFDGLLARLLAQQDSNLHFQLSRRLTRAAGQTSSFRRPNHHGTNPPMGTCYRIAISSQLLFQSFAQVQRPIFVNGLSCRDRLEALQRIMEHELLHLWEMLLWGESSCTAKRFKSMAGNLFGHTESLHGLVTSPELALVHHGIRTGDQVTFEFQGTRHVGVVSRIAKRATVLVESALGRTYSDGRCYTKYYVPLSLLQKTGAEPSGSPGGSPPFVP